MDRRPGSGSPCPATTEENVERVEDLVCSREEPGSHVHPREITNKLGISHTSARRIIKEKNINQSKRVKILHVNDVTRQRRIERVSNLGENFSKNSRIIERGVFQEESDFPLEIPINNQNNHVYFKGKKCDVPDENLCHQTNLKR